MKSLYESLLTGNVSKPRAKVQPSSRDELKQIIDGYIEDIKPHPGQEVDLNWIDISHVDDLSELFRNTNYIPVIDKWKIDHVKYFACMFAGNEYITRSPLPVLQEKLASECYEAMFAGCTTLKEPPVLPAKKLTNNCYTSMFHGCTSLVYAPALPATKLAYGCYYYMFKDCSSLKQTPQLPAKILAPYCYRSMFQSCSSLKVTPELPAEQLALRCYMNMFERCEAFKDLSSCVLPATVLSEGCYERMFYKCKNMIKKPVIAAKLSPKYAHEMFGMCYKLNE